MMEGDRGRPATTTTILLALAALTGGLAVVLGALGSHLAEGENATRIEIATRYAMWHALAVMAFAACRPERWLAPLFWLLGVAGFAGGLVAAAFGAPAAFLQITPFGGSLLILGWIVAALSFLADLRSR